MIDVKMIHFFFIELLFDKKKIQIYLRLMQKSEI